MVQPRTEAQGAIQFHYLAEIAVGTTARVDLCRADSPPHLAGKLLAVKRLHQHIAEDPAFANQFLDEVWMTAALKQPNVVEVAGWGNDDDGMYLAVELVQGVSLARLMKTIFDTGEAFTERMVVYIVSRLCRGLAAAHSLRAANGEPLGLVHRDLTPGNVLVGFTGAIKITDFGLAKAKQRLTKTLTGLLKGQPQYMAPEQARGEAIDLRTDLFALGVLMFELFAGRKPWLAASDYDAVQAILMRPPDDLRELRPKIDKELAAVVQRCLEKNPAARFQSATEIQARLEEWLLVHGYQEGNEEALARFVRRNAMRQMRWFERAVAGELTAGRPEPPKASAYTGQNPAFSYKDDDDGSDDETDITDAESMVAQLAQRSNDPRAAQVSSPDEAELAEEVPTIVLKSGSLPLPAKGAAQAPAKAAPGPAARAPVIARPAAKTPPPPPQRVAPKAPIAPSASPSPGPSGAPRAPAARVQSRPPQGAIAPSAPFVPSGGRPPSDQRSVAPMRPIHESIIDEESDASTTAVKPRGARPSGVRTPLIIQTPPREPAPSISDPESEEVPTLPLQGFPNGASRRSSPTSLSSPQAARQQSEPPGKIAPPGPNVPVPPTQGRALPSLQSVEDEPSNGRAPMTEDRLFAEADRLALEAVRQSDEAKAAAARAERQAVIAKIAGDAAAIAVEAVRISSTQGVVEAARRFEDAYALEATIRRLSAAPLDVPIPSMRPGRSTERIVPQSAPPPHPSSPGGPQPHDGRPSYPAPMSPSQSSPSHVGPTAQASSPAHGMPPAHGIQPGVAPSTGQFDAFEEKLRPMIFGLPSLHVAALAIGTFVLVLVLMWILMG